MNNHKHALAYNIIHARDPREQLNIEAQLRAVEPEDVCQMLDCVTLKDIFLLYTGSLDGYTEGRRHKYMEADTVGMKTTAAHREYNRRWYEAHREQENEKRRLAYYKKKQAAEEPKPKPEPEPKPEPKPKADPEKAAAKKAKKAAYWREYYQRNKEKILAQQRAYQKANRQKLRAYSHEYYLKHVEEKLAYSREYAKQHREEYKAYNKAYRQRKKDREANGMDRQKEAEG